MHNLKFESLGDVVTVEGLTLFNAFGTMEDGTKFKIPIPLEAAIETIQKGNYQVVPMDSKQPPPEETEEETNVQDTTP